MFEALQSVGVLKMRYLILKCLYSNHVMSLLVLDLLLKHLDLSLQMLFFFSVGKPHRFQVLILSESALSKIRIESFVFSLEQLENSIH